MSSMCPYVCDNKTVGGFCRTTFCINPTHSNIGTAQFGQGVQKQIVTNADRIRAMTDEELAREFTRLDMFCCPVTGVTCANEPKCQDCFKRWLKQEAET